MRYKKCSEISSLWCLFCCDSTAAGTSSQAASHTELWCEDRPYIKKIELKTSGFCLQELCCTYCLTCFYVPLRGSKKHSKKRKTCQPTAWDGGMKRIIRHLHCQRIYFYTREKKLPSEIMIGFVSSVQNYKGLIKAKFSITINDSPHTPPEADSHEWV